MADFDQDEGLGGTVGQRLRRAREAKGLTLEDVATRTRIPIRHLRSIEDSKWDDLPAITYTVGFGRAYANAIGLDGSEVGRELRDQLGYSQRPAISPEYYDPPDPARVPSRTIAWIAAILAVVLLVGWLIWSGRDDEVAEAPPVEQQAPPPQAAPAQPAPPPSFAGQPVTLVAEEDAWVRITDRAAENRQIVERIIPAGEQVQVPADARQPVIVTSRPQVLRVMVGGQEIGRLGTREGRVSDISLLANDLVQMIRGQGQPAPGPARTR
jgi:cytoskeleton protein RodZ